LTGRKLHAAFLNVQHKQILFDFRYAATLLVIPTESRKALALKAFFSGGLFLGSVLNDCVANVITHTA